MGSSRREVLLQTALGLTIFALPLVLLYWLLANPRRNLEVLALREHFLIVSNVSLVAIIAAALLARMALQIDQRRRLLLALGFMSMAALFMVHAIATPGVLMRGHADDYGGTMIGLSAYLSLFVPSLFFAAQYLPRLRVRNRTLSVQPRLLMAGVAAALLAYATIGIAWAPTVANLPLSQPPLSYVLAGLAMLLFGIAAWCQARAPSELPVGLKWGLVAAYLLLADAQLSMVLGPLWTLAWWEYHVLMLVAVAMALSALYVELDRRRTRELQQQQEALIEVRSRAEALAQAEAAKTEIISMVSHELRTPLTAVQGFAELLVAGHAAEEQRSLWLKTIHDEANRLGVILDELLDVARLEGGVVRVSREHVRICELVAQVAATFAGQSRTHQIDVDLEDPDLVLIADRGRVMQILQNLLSNAVKYSPEGGRIRVLVRHTSGEALISVRDEGMGIPPDQLPRLFTRFHRVDTPDRRAIRGTGLGLYITHELVTLHGGRIWVESEAGAGSTFTFTLPQVQFVT